MRKSLKSLSVALIVSFLFSAYACAREVEYDYSATELKIEKREAFAPCWFWDFFYQNEYTAEYFPFPFPA